MAENPEPPLDEAQGEPSDTAPGKPSEAGQGKQPDQPGDYFESMTVRLDSAIAAKLAAGRRPPSADTPAVTTSADQDASGDFPTLHRILSGESATPAPTPASSTVAKAFAALLALEEGQPGARPVRLVTGDSEPRITDEILEELTRRVIDRLGSSTTRDLVVQVVSQVAERLVSAEIERIRKKHV